MSWASSVCEKGRDLLPAVVVLQLCLPPCAKHSKSAHRLRKVRVGTPYSAMRVRCLAMCVDTAQESTGALFFLSNVIMVQSLLEGQVTVLELTELLICLYV